MSLLVHFAIGLVAGTIASLIMNAVLDRRSSRPRPPGDVSPR